MCCIHLNYFDCRIASLSKIFPTLMLYKLWEDGLIDSLDDPLEKYTDNFTIKNPLGKSDEPTFSSARTFGSRSPALTLRRMASQLSGNTKICSNVMMAIFDKVFLSHFGTFLRSEFKISKSHVQPPHDRHLHIKNCNFFFLLFLLNKSFANALAHSCK